MIFRTTNRLMSDEQRQMDEADTKVEGCIEYIDFLLYYFVFELLHYIFYLHFLKECSKKKGRTTDR